MAARTYGDILAEKLAAAEEKRKQAGIGYPFLVRVRETRQQWETVARCRTAEVALMDLARHMTEGKFKRGDVVLAHDGEFEVVFEIVRKF